MSTERNKNKRRFVRLERIKIIEYGCIALVILLFLVLAIVYGSNQKTQNGRSASTTASSFPTPDTSIRGMNVLNALEDAGFSVDYDTDRYAILSPKGVSFTLRMLSDDKGIATLSVETLLCPDPEDQTETAKLIQKENRETVDALTELFDCMIQVFDRSQSNGATIVKQCQKVVKSGEPYVKQWGDYSVRITSDLMQIPQTVVITLTRDPR